MKEISFRVREKMQGEGVRRIEFGFGNSEAFEKGIYVIFVPMEPPIRKYSQSRKYFLLPRSSTVVFFAVFLAMAALDAGIFAGQCRRGRKKTKADKESLDASK